MPAIEIRDGRLTLHFTSWERLLLFGPGVVSVPVDAIDDVRVEPGWTSEILGLRKGTVVSGWYKLGTFTHPSGIRRLVAMKRGLPLLRVGVRDRAASDGIDELLLSTPSAQAIASSLRAARTGGRI